MSEMLYFIAGFSLASVFWYSQLRSQRRFFTKLLEVRANTDEWLFEKLGKSPVFRTPPKEQSDV